MKKLPVTFYNALGGLDMSVEMTSRVSEISASLTRDLSKIDLGCLEGGQVWELLNQFPPFR